MFKSFVQRSLKGVFSQTLTPRSVTRNARLFGVSRLLRFNTPVSTSPRTYRSVVLTAAGPDRPGIVNELAKTLHDGNIEESRMTILGTDFALIVLVTIPQTITAAALRDRVAAKFSDFAVSARDTSTEQDVSLPGRVWQLLLEGPDQPGVISELTKVLVDHGANIRDLEMDTASAPFAGYKMFHLKAIINTPKQTNLESLETALTQFEQDWGVDLSLDDPRDLSDEEESMTDTDSETEAEGVVESDSEAEDSSSSSSSSRKQASAAGKSAAKPAAAAAVKPSSPSGPAQSTVSRFRK